MTRNHKKRTYANNNSANASDGEYITRSISESETDRSEQNSSIEDNLLSETNQLSALLKRLETLEKLQATNNKINNRRIEPILDDTNNNISKKKQRKKNSKTNKRNHKDDSSSETESTSNEDSIESLRLMITAKYEKSVPEYCKISENKKNEIIRRVKVTRTPSPENHTRSITDSCTTSVSCIPLTTLQQPNANEVQDISSDYTNEASETPSKKPQNSGYSHMLHSNNNPVKKATEAKTQSNDLVNETTEASNIKNNAKK
ncbi:16629_t:CDS:2 [Cetraspora pellucida]|uniref:16629_t:CDS:1 n=1 Tax=Cetraspora pellucida TaxID=1433469 RepID=A0ACA9MY78_9GLOM|nr:16629_t:CDS:2 [Cetraspora pellucida]